MKGTSWLKIQWKLRERRGGWVKGVARIQSTAAMHKSYSFYSYI
jgi:hypothetical protein